MKEEVDQGNEMAAIKNLLTILQQELDRQARFSVDMKKQSCAKFVEVKNLIEQQDALPVLLDKKENLDQFHEIKSILKQKLATDDAHVRSKTTQMQPGIIYS